jgi:hypothetical protein
LVRFYVAANRPDEAAVWWEKAAEFAQRFHFDSPAPLAKVN